jgi:hypothetical protein
METMYKEGTLAEDPIFRYTHTGKLEVTFYIEEKASTFCALKRMKVVGRKAEQLKQLTKGDFISVNCYKDITVYKDKKETTKEYVQYIVTKIFRGGSNVDDN